MINLDVILCQMLESALNAAPPERGVSGRIERLRTGEQNTLRIIVGRKTCSTKPYRRLEAVDNGTAAAAAAAAAAAREGVYL